MTSADSLLARASLRDRFRGALLGLAVGDALGAPLEFQPPRQPDDYVTEMIGGGWLRLAPGQWTDDTQLTLATVESLIQKRVFDPDDIAHRFVNWLDSKPADVGSHTRRVLETIKHGTPWEVASDEAYHASPDNASNGSLMRCSPLALFLFRSPEYVATLSPVLSRITHAHPDCEAACVFLNVTLAYLLNAEDRFAAVASAKDTDMDYSAELRGRIEKIFLPSNETAPTGWVLDTLEVAFWTFLHTPNFESALLVAVNRGEDADTVGAVTGALAGGYYGLSQIPQRWLEPLYQKDRLIQIADALLELALTEY